MPNLNSTAEERKPRNCLNQTLDLIVESLCFITAQVLSAVTFEGHDRDQSDRAIKLFQISPYISHFQNAQSQRAIKEYLSYYYSHIT